ncbi:diacylglycerol kinase family protein [Legionella sp. W05-934-2]|jgi:YegS/Rv2252/BmrU family lipid kinase|uniref:diacylglycerol/lipid kinase family protein n=1 Tax=Legionella sp. W05-934-2 TaxID=1198649 RepID=UPI00346320DE
MRSISVIINPAAGGGRGQKVWQVLHPGLKALSDKITYRMTNYTDDLVKLVRGLLADEPDYFIVIGGDGTLSHAVNGFIDNDRFLSKRTQFAYFNAGCGGDFARQFGSQHVTEFLNHLTHNQGVACNIGKISYANNKTRYFINIASCGLSAQVIKYSSATSWLKKLGGGVNYFIHSLQGILTYQSTPVTIQFDEHPPFEGDMLLMAVCNGQYFGGNMHVAPMANLNDGLLDVVIFHDFTKLQALWKLRKIYSGRHLLEKKVKFVQAKTVSIEGQLEQPLFIEADGELVGQLPATFSLLPQTLSVVV